MENASNNEPDAVIESSTPCSCCVVCLDPIAVDPSVHPLMLSSGVLCSKYAHILCKDDLNRVRHSSEHFCFT